jgi:transketolase
MAYLLFQKWINHDPTDPKWHGRDRFVLSNGHSSITLYIQLFLSGYDLELEDLQSFRTWDSKTPGHPEFGHTDGVEATTGPLGTGLATAVGMAMDARYVRNLLDPKAVKGQSVFDHKIWVIAGDGCLQEGVTSEASSLAGHQNLSDLVVLYDDNHISIEGDTAVSCTEDVLARYESYGWNVSHVEMLPTGEIDVVALDLAIANAVAQSEKPSLIRVRNVIGWPAPNLKNTGKIHGSALGEAEVAATKEILGLESSEAFQISAELLSHTRQVAVRGSESHANWSKQFSDWAANNSDSAKLFEAINGDDFKNKLEETLSQMQGLFDMPSTTENDDSTKMPEGMPNANDIHEHINGMLDGQLGKLAKEIAEETASNLNIDMENVTDMKDVFSNLIKILIFLLKYI